MSEYAHLKNESLFGESTGITTGTDDRYVQMADEAIADQRSTKDGIVRARIAKTTRWLRALSFVQLILAGVMILVGFTCFAMHLSADHWYATPGCNFGTSAWVGCLAAFTAFLGVASLWTGEIRYRGVFVAYFVLNILMIFALIVSALASTAHAFNQHKGAFHMNVTLLISTVVHAIVTILSLCHICHIWAYTGCCGGSTPLVGTTIVFVQAAPATATANVEGTTV